MFNFNLKTVPIYQAILRQNFFNSAEKLKKILLAVSFLFLIFFIYSSVTEKQGSDTMSSFMLGTLIIFLSLAVFFWILEAFFNSIKAPKPKIALAEAINDPESHNMAGFLSFGAANAVWSTLRFAQAKRISQISSTLLFYFLLKEKSSLPKINFIFSRAYISLKEVERILKEKLKKIQFSQEDTKEKHKEESYSPDFRSVILEAGKNAKNQGKETIGSGNLLVALARQNLFFKNFLMEYDLRKEDIENLTWWTNLIEKKAKESKEFWEYKNLIKIGSLAKDWVSGYTVTLDQFSVDWSSIARKQKFWESVGHKSEIEQAERILSRTEINNVLLVGEGGTGRKSMIQAIAQKSIAGESLPEVNHKRIVELKISAILSHYTSFEEVELVLDTIFKEVVKAGNVILVINNFHNFIGRKTQLGMVDITGILAQYLHLPQFQIIGITTPPGLHKYIELRPAIVNLFDKVKISSISERETLLLLGNLAFALEEKYKCFITYPALRDIVKLTARYLPAIPFPKKALDILDETMIYVTKFAKDRVLLPQDIARIVTEKTQIPVGILETREKEVLLSLENLIHQRIVNQEKAVKEIASSLRRARADITVRKGPMGTFLFLGPTGVGKTETSKALAEFYFSDEERMIRLDMSEFQDTKDIARLIGSPGQEGLLTTKIREKPFSLILLDEIEKAHPNILNLFLQVFDEGRLTDGLGRITNFKNSIIIATSNAGYKVILKAIKEKIEWSQVKESLLNYLFEEGIFRPELINRFDAVIAFRPLSKENLLDIAQLLLQKLKENLQKKDIELIVTQELKEKIVELGYNPVFGAREMRRVIQDQVENVLAKAILAEELKRGSRVRIDPSEFKLIIEQ